MKTPLIDQQCINTIRTLSMDAVQQANSGHPGTAMPHRAQSAYGGVVLPRWKTQTSSSCLE
jgi:hypothetical protein